MKELGILNEDVTEKKSEPLKENHKVRRQLNFDSEKEDSETPAPTEKRRSRRLATTQLVHFTDE